MTKIIVSLFALLVLAGCNTVRPVEQNKTETNITIDASK